MTWVFKKSFIKGNYVLPEKLIMIRGDYDIEERILTKLEKIGQCVVGQRKSFDGVIWYAIDLVKQTFHCRKNKVELLATIVNGTLTNGIECRILSDISQLI